MINSIDELKDFGMGVIQIIAVCWITVIGFFIAIVLPVLIMSYFINQIIKL